jgi:hypothetical protein
MLLLSLKMKTLVLLFLLVLSSVSAWDVDRRCLGEGTLLTGDDVGQEMFEEMRVDEEDEEGVMFRNQSLYTNTSRHLQSGGSYNLKMSWKQGVCWQDEWRERKWCMGCRGVSAHHGAFVLLFNFLLLTHTLFHSCLILVSLRAAAAVARLNLNRYVDHNTTMPLSRLSKF